MQLWKCRNCGDHQNTEFEPFECYACGVGGDIFEWVEENETEDNAS